MDWQDGLTDQFRDMLCGGCTAEEGDLDPCDTCPGMEIFGEIARMVIEPISDLLENLVEP